MSPQQVCGDTVDARSDLFSLGAVLYEMLTGRPAFTRDTSTATRDGGAHRRAADCQADVPPALARVVSRCLEKSPSARFQTARDLVFCLEGVTATDASPIAAPAPAGVGAMAHGRGDRRGRYWA